MTHHPAATRRTPAFVSLWIAFVLSCVVLYFNFTDPFRGTWTYAGRILSPLTVTLLALAIVKQRRARGVGLVIGVVLALTALLIVGGRGS